MNPVEKDALFPEVNEGLNSFEISDEVEGQFLKRTISFGDMKFSSSRRRPVKHQGYSDESSSDEWWRSFLLGNELSSEQSNGSLSFVDLFASTGGLSLALTEAAQSLGFRPNALFAADLDVRALEVYQSHFSPLFTHCGDVDHLVDVDGFINDCHSRGQLIDVILDDRLKKLVGEVDVLVAGPPCQGHSSLNNATRHEDPRNRFYLHPVAIGIALRARAILIENVPGVRRDSSEVVKRAEQLLIRHGYSVSASVLKAEKLGWPQTRHRYFLVATRSDRCIDLGVMAKQLYSPTKPIAWAIHDLLDVLGIDILHSPANMSVDNQRRIDWLFENNASHLPDELRPACHRDKDHTYSTVYGRMHWDRPAGTITTGFSTPGRGRFIHPLRPRTLLPIEAARIQGFPDYYFQRPKVSAPFSRTEIAKWIGDAVPPPLGFPAVLCAIGTLLTTGLLIPKQMRKIVGSNDAK